MKRVLLLTGALLGVAQCTCGVPGVGDELYVCRVNADCLGNNECIGGHCRPKGTVLCQVTDCVDPGCDGKSCGTSGQVCSNKVCSCSGNGGPVQTNELACADGADNDCDGLTDCADNDCDAKACGMGGTCGAGICSCAAAGTAPQPVETLCSDGLDNDCDSVTDCADPSCVNQSCAAMGKVCSLDGGACLCGGNGGPAEGSESLCADLADNDCDGKTDCGDDTCNTQPCRPNGFFCAGVVCACSGNGGAVEQAGELSCTDGFDNDCDGLSDCADPSCDTVSCGAGCTCLMGAKRETACTDTMDNDSDLQVDCADGDCNGAACGMFGLSCVSGMCKCAVDGGTVETDETICADGKDNDCDGLSDCGEASCLGLSCGPSGRVCVGAICTCFVDGGVTEPTEVSCNDGRDNDCDALIDCADSNCAGMSCGVGCSCTGGVKAETACNDGMDNDGDGQTDCADSQCSHKQCGATAASVCCGTVCRNLGTDSANCGGCGLSCAMSCTPVTAGGVATGHCTCNGNGNCPSGQSCGGGVCVCNAANDCAAGEVCGSSSCHY